jgi:hypothetical protein
MDKEESVKVRAKAWEMRFNTLPEFLRSDVMAKELGKYFRKDNPMTLEEFLSEYLPAASEFELNAIKAYIRANYVDSMTTRDLFKIWSDPMTSEELRKEIENEMQHG